MTAFIHHLADVKSNDVGCDTNVWQFCVVLEGAKIGSNCNICAHVFIESDVVIGNHVTVKCGVQLWSGVRLEDNVFIGPNVTFTNDGIPRGKQYRASFSPASVIVRNGASIGANATLVGPLDIREFAMVGAGSVVTKNIGPYELWHGVPATHRGYITPDGRLFDLDQYELFQQVLMDKDHG